MEMTKRAKRGSAAGAANSEDQKHIEKLAADLGGEKLLKQLLA